METKCNKEGLSIIVPCFNAQDTIRRCLDSLLCQTAETVQIICVNDGSTDDTPRILDEYARKHSNQFVVIHTPNRGSWAARTTGIHEARGTYVGFLDSDDCVLPTFAHTMLHAARTNDADMVICGFERMDAVSSKVLSQEMCKARTPFMVGQEPGRTIEVNSAMWNKIFSIRVLDGMEEVSCPPPVAEDFLFQTLFFAHSKGPIVFVPEPLVHYFVHTGSLMSSIGPSEVTATYRAMAAIRVILQNKNLSHAFLEAFDTSAFLHLGVSLNSRLSANPSV